MIILDIYTNCAERGARRRRRARRRLRDACQHRPHRIQYCPGDTPHHCAMPEERKAVSWQELFATEAERGRRAANAAASLPHGGSLSSAQAARKASTSATFEAAKADARRGSRLTALIGAGLPFPDCFFPIGMQAAANAMKAAAAYVLGCDCPVGQSTTASTGKTRQRQV